MWIKDKKKVKAEFRDFPNIPESLESQTLSALPSINNSKGREEAHYLQALVQWEHKI